MATGVRKFAGTGSPEGVTTAPPGSAYQQTDAVAGNELWDKATGTGNTGWRLRGSTTSEAALAREFHPDILDIPLEVVTDFSTGHGWTASPAMGAGESLNDTTDYLLSTQCVTRVHPGDGVGRTIDRTGLSLNTVNKNVRIGIKSSSWTSVSGVTLYMSNDSGFTNFYQWNFYGGAASDDSMFIYKHGEWTWFTLDFDAASTTGTPHRSGITTLRFRIDSSSGTNTTVKFGALGLMPYSHQYPQGVVSFTFDDYYASIYSVARPTLAKYGWAGTTWLIADQITDPAISGRMSLTEVKSLQDDYGWEVGGHANTATTHSGTGYQQYSLANAEADLKALKQWLKDNNLTAETFAWPFGNFTTALEARAKKYFSTIRTVQQGRETLPPGNPWRLRQTPLDNTRSLAQVQTEVDRVQRNGGWLVLMGHSLGTGQGGTQWDSGEFATLCAYIAGKGMPVVPVQGVLESIRAVENENPQTIQSYTPYSYPVGGGSWQTASGTNVVLAVSGGSIAFPVYVTSHMLLQSLTFWTTDATVSHTLDGCLVREMTNLTAALPVVTTFASITYTASAAAPRTLTPLGTPVTVSPGTYWCVIRNTGGATTGIGMTALGVAMATNVHQTKTLGTAAFGTSLDMTAATWTKGTTLPIARLNGRSFGQTSAF